MRTMFSWSKARRAFDESAVTVINGWRQWAPAAALVVAMALVLAPDALVAGNGGSEFDNVWIWLVDVTQGTLGRILAGAMVLVGVVGGIARQSLMAFATGIGGALGLNYAPDIIDAVMSATINVAHLPVY